MSLRMSSWGALPAALLVALAPALVRADTSLVATGAVDTGYSTNIQGTPESDDPMAPQVLADGFMSLRPGLSAAYERPRSTHNLNYTFGAQLYLTSTEANSYSNTLAYQSLIATSARGSLRLGASFNAGRLNNFNQPGQQVGQPGDVQPDGDTSFISYNANASYRHLLSQRMTGEVAVGGTRFEPSSGGLVGPTTNSDLRVRLERSYRYHLLGADARLSYTKQEVPEVQRSLIAGPGVFWTWNVTQSISTNATAGADAVGEYPAFSRGITVPRGSAAVTYSHERGRATAGFARGAAVNIFGGDTTIDNSFFLNAGLPVPLPIERPVALTAGVVYSTGRIIDLDIGDTRGRNKRLSADVLLGTQINPAWLLAFRFNTSKQERQDITEMGTVNSITRQTIVSVVLTGRFPQEIAGQVPRQSSDRVESGNAAFRPEPPPAQAPGESSAPTPAPPR
jgi:hypothetical protein